MIDGEAFRRYDAALAALDDLTAKSVKALVGLLAQYPDDRLEDALNMHLPAIASLYGKAAANAALDFYRAEMQASGADSGFEPVAAEPIQQAWVAEAVSEAMAPQLRGTSDRTGLAGNLAGRMERMVRERADRTITYNARRDPADPRWAIVPHVGACPWCIMVSSWGFRYRSESSALAQRHANCRCTVVKDSDTDNPALEGYDPDGMRQRLLQCGKDFGGGENNWNRSMEAAKYYDREWLRTGERPEVGYASDAVWEKKWSDPRAHGLERGTAEILADHGFKIVFQDDEINGIPNPNGLGTITVGLPDLDTGVEIKTLYGASTYNTFSSHISNGASKAGLDLIVVDVNSNYRVDDAQSREWITRRLKRYPEISGVIMIGHEKEFDWVASDREE